MLLCHRWGKPSAWHYAADQKGPCFEFGMDPVTPRWLHLKRTRSRRGAGEGWLCAAAHSWAVGCCRPVTDQGKLLGSPLFPVCFPRGNGSFAVMFYIIRILFSDSSGIFIMVAGEYFSSTGGAGLYCGSDILPEDLFGLILFLPLLILLVPENFAKEEICQGYGVRTEFSSPVITQANPFDWAAGPLRVAWDWQELGLRWAVASFGTVRLSESQPLRKQVLCFICTSPAYSQLLSQLSLLPCAVCLCSGKIPEQIVLTDSVYLRDKLGSVETPGSCMGKLYHEEPFELHLGESCFFQHSSLLNKLIPV